MQDENIKPQYRKVDEEADDGDDDDSDVSDDDVGDDEDHVAHPDNNDINDDIADSKVRHHY